MGNYQEIKNNQTLPSGIYEDVGAFCSGGCKAGWLGNSANNYLEWRDVCVTTSGTYDLAIGYISGENRSMKLYVDGELVQNLTGLNSGAWNRVAKRSVKVQLEEGLHTVRLSNASAWMPDIDCMELVLENNSSAVESIPKTTAPTSQAYTVGGQPIDASRAHGIVVQDGRARINK